MAMTFEVNCKDCGKYVICMKPKEGKYPQYLLPCYSYNPVNEEKKGKKK